MKPGLELSGSISEDRLTLSWTKPLNFSSFNIKIGEGKRKKYFSLFFIIPCRSLWSEGWLLQNSWWGCRWRFNILTPGWGLHPVLHLQHSAGGVQSPAAQDVGRGEPRQQNSGVLAHWWQEPVDHHPHRGHATPPLNHSLGLLLSQQESQEVDSNPGLRHPNI